MEIIFLHDCFVFIFVYINLNELNNLNIKKKIEFIRRNKNYRGKWILWKKY